jgi:hypothetical protein
VLDEFVVGQTMAVARWHDNDLSVGQTTENACLRNNNNDSVMHYARGKLTWRGGIQWCSVASCWHDNKLAAGQTMMLVCWHDAESVVGQTTMVLAVLSPPVVTGGLVVSTHNQILMICLNRNFEICLNRKNIQLHYGSCTDNK